MSNPDLTESNMSVYKINPEVIAYLEEFRKKRGLCRENVKVLDWGCGRGQSVIRLRELGYCVMGADIDIGNLENARSLYVKLGLVWEDLLHPLNPDASSPFPNNYFDFVFSEEVIEHVEDLRSTAKELARITAPGGMQLHLYPAHREIVEDHLHMPLIHWLPKNGVRKAVIALAMLLKFCPDWPDTNDKPFKQRLHHYFEYSVKHTHFRAWDQVRRTFFSCGFDIKFVTINNPKLREHPVLQWLSQRRWSRPALNWVLLTFKRVELLGIKRKGNGFADYRNRLIAN